MSIAVLPRRPVRRSSQRGAAIQVLAIGLYGTVLLVLLALMAGGLVGMRIDGHTLQLLACETIALPALLGLALVGLPRCSSASALRCGVSLWAVSQAACVPFTPWPVLLLTATASLGGYLVVGGLLTVAAKARPQPVQHAVCIAVEPAFLPTPGRMEPPASA